MLSKIRWLAENCVAVCQVVRPGNVPTVSFPGATGLKRRPVVAVSTDTYHTARPDVIVAV